MAAIDQGMSADELAVAPLWFRGSPRFVSERWIRLRKFLISLDEGWEVWIEWYDERVKGTPSDPEFDIARASIDEKVWKGGAKTANECIKSLPRVRPTDIPKQEAASIEPFWEGGLLTISDNPGEVDIGQDEFVSALQALRIELNQFRDDLDVEENIDPRFLTFISNLESQIPETPPSSTEIFRLGHNEEILSRYTRTVDEQWPEFLAARYSAVSQQFSRTMRQSRLWREFKKNASASDFSPGQLAAAGVLAGEVAKSLAGDESKEFVDPKIPASLAKLADAAQQNAATETDKMPDDPIKGGRYIAADLIASVNNILKRIAEAALLIKSPTIDVLENAKHVVKKGAENYGKGFAKSFAKTATTIGTKDGEKALKYLRHLIIGAGSVFIFRLIQTFPETFRWFERFVANLFG